MTLPRIRVRNIQRTISVNGAELESFAGDAVKRCLKLGRGKRTELRKLNAISVWLVSDWRISRLHRKFFGDSKPTDVITFHAGEIFISVETARQNARKFGNSLMSELKLNMVHGFLHLHGFDDRTPPDLRRMHDTQERILSQMGVQVGSDSQV